jgi:hypothetical protein
VDMLEWGMNSGSCLSIRGSFIGCALFTDDRSQMTENRRQMSEKEFTTEKHGISRKIISLYYCKYHRPLRVFAVMAHGFNLPTQ